jgi:hypothetical protein
MSIDTDKQMPHIAILYKEANEFSRKQQLGHKISNEELARMIVLLIEIILRTH